MSIQSLKSKRLVKSQRGYSLIELSIAMAILSVIIVGSLVGVQRILANNRTNNVLQFVPRMNATLISGTLGGGSSTIINTNLAAQLGAFDPTTVTGTGGDQKVRNEYGGTYNVISNKVAVGSSAARGGYFIYITNVPKSVCPVALAVLVPVKAWKQMCLWMLKKLVLCSTRIASGPYLISLV